MARVQLILHTQHRGLSYTRRGLKESKCFWTIQNYTQKDGKYSLVKDTQFQLVIKRNQKDTPIKFIPPDEPRMLVRVITVLSYDPAKIIPYFDLKLSEYSARLEISTLSLSQILNEYKVYWQPSLKYMSLLISLPIRLNLLSSFYRKLLP